MRLVPVALWTAFVVSLAPPPSGVSDGPPSQTSTRTRVVVLGSGNPGANPSRFGPAIVVLVDDTPYLFDIGVGIIRRWAAVTQMGIANVELGSLRTAFVTHLHSDHTLGYADLILTPWMLGGGHAQPLVVYGPAGLQDMTDHLLAAYSEDVAVRTGEGAGDLEGAPAPTVMVHEIEPGVVYRDSLVAVTAFAVPHGTWRQAFGYRIQTPDKVIVVSGDTGPTNAVAEHCAGCDLLFYEGGFATDSTATDYYLRFHATAEEVARAAQLARPKLLVLYHQRPTGPVTEAAYAVLRSLYAGPFVVASDLDVLR
jgi:ribonuclease BN (tRNA processing enzyme)